MAIRNRKTKILYGLPNVENFEQGQKFTLNQGFDDSPFENINLTGEEREKMELYTKEVGREIMKEDAVQNIVGLLFNEYYNQEKDFRKDKKLVTELQRNLKLLDYPLGNSGEKGNGIDGDFGVRTKTAIGNFEQDFSKRISEMADQKEQVQNAIKGKTR